MTVATGRFRTGVGVARGSGAMDAGFTHVQPPGFPPAPPKSVFSNGATLVALASAAWLVVLYVHFHTY